MSDKKQKIRIKDDATVAEIYVNKLITTFFDGHALVATLGTQRFVPEYTTDAPAGHPPVHVNCRLALSPPAAIELINALNGMLAAASRATLQPGNPPGKAN